MANTGWLFADRIMRMGVGLVVGVWIARYLGPEQFGLLNYASAFVALFGAIAGLGLNGIVVRDLVKEPETANTTLGTAFVLQLFGGLLAFAIAFLAIRYARPDDSLTQLIVAILGLALVFKASEVVKYWFESQVQSKYTVWVENAAFVVFAGIKVVLIINHAPLIDFVWVVLIEAALVAIALLGIYAWQRGDLISWHIKIKRAKSLLQDSWPLILSGLAVMIYMRIDQIMLGQMLGDEAVGIYSAAVRISEVWYFIPMSIVASVFPAILEAKKHSEAQYYARLQKLYDLMVLLSVSIALPMTFIATPVIVVLYGDAYAASGTILAIHIWAAVFVFLGVASGKWFLAENRQVLNLQRTVLGAVANIVLNLLLIPRYGVIGAAVATVISQMATAWLFDCFQTETKKMFFMKVYAANPVRIFSHQNKNRKS